MIKIAQDGMFETSSKCFQDKIRRFEIHIGYPHGNHIRSAEYLLSYVVFQTTGIISGNNFVKIILHNVIKMHVQSYCLIFKVFFQYYDFLNICL